MTAIVKKLSVKKVLKTRPEIPTEFGKVNYVMDVIGIASGIENGVSDFGPWTKFQGSFQATNLKTGEVFRSGALFLPDVAGNMLIGALASGQNKSVEFGFKIGVVKDDESATGYVYVAEPLMKPSENDPFELLANKISSEQKKLEHNPEEKNKKK